MHIRFATLAIFLLSFTLARAQSEGDSLALPEPEAYPRKYFSNTYPLQFNFSSAIDGDGTAGPLRFTPLCLESYRNYDRSEHFGIYWGLGCRQIGYIRTLDDGLRLKFRTWNLSLPIGIKLGNMGRGTFFLGYRLEWPFHYRERSFLDDGRILSRAEWVSRRVPAFSHGAEIGYQFKGGLAIRLEYYLNPFHRSSFQEEVDGVRVKPYEEWKDVHVAGVSIIIRPFKPKGQDDGDGKPDFPPLIPPLEI